MMYPFLLRAAPSKVELFIDILLIRSDFNSNYLSIHLAIFDICDGKHLFFF